MPVIPRYHPQTQRPLQLRAPRQSIHTPEEAFGDTATLRAAQGLAGQLADTMVRFQLKQKKEKDAAWVSQSMSALATRYDDHVFGTDDAPGVYSRKGRDAIGATKESRDALQAYIDEILVDAPNQEAAQQFQQRALSLRASTAQSIARHESTETQRWLVDSKAENASSQLQRIASHWSWKPEEIEIEFTAQVRPELVDIAKSRGVPVEKLVRTQKAKVFAEVIKQNIAVGATQRATALLERWTDKLDADTRTALTASIRKRTIEATAEDTAFRYYGQLKTGDISQSEAAEEINAIEDPDLRRVTRRLFDTYARQWKIDQAAWVNQETVARVAELDNLVGDLVSQQQFVEKYPDETPEQRKVKTQLEARLKRHKSAQGLQPMTDPAAYTEAVEAIISGDITNGDQIDAQYSVTIEKANREQLKRDLKAAQATTKRALKAAYTTARGIAGGTEARLSGSRKKDFGEFMLWAEEMLKDSNRAQEPDYLQKLADIWILEGEREGGGFGYGRDMPLSRAVKTGEVDKWLPEMPDKEIVDQIKTTLDTHPEVKKMWLDAYGNEDLAIRGYYKKLLMYQIGKKTGDGSASAQ